MYKIVSSARAWWPVTFPGVTEDGSVVENRIEMQFRLLTLDAFVAEMERVQALATTAGRLDAAAGGKPLSRIMAETLEPLLLNWRGIAAENGEPLPWSTDNLAALMNVPGTFDAVLSAFKACIAGRAQVSAGN